MVCSKILLTTLHIAQKQIKAYFWLFLQPDNCKKTQSLKTETCAKKNFLILNGPINVSFTL